MLRPSASLLHYFCKNKPFFQSVAAQALKPDVILTAHKSYVKTEQNMEPKMETKIEPKIETKIDTEIEPKIELKTNLKMKPNRVGYTDVQVGSDDKKLSSRERKRSRSPQADRKEHHKRDNNFPEKGSPRQRRDDKDIKPRRPRNDYSPKHKHNQDHQRDSFKVKLPKDRSAVYREQHEEQIEKQIEEQIEDICAVSASNSLEEDPEDQIAEFGGEHFDGRFKLKGKNMKKKFQVISPKDSFRVDWARVLNGASPNTKEFLAKLLNKKSNLYEDRIYRQAENLVDYGYKGVVTMYDCILLAITLRKTGVAALLDFSNRAIHALCKKRKISDENSGDHNLPVINDEGILVAFTRSVEDLMASREVKLRHVLKKIKITLAEVLRFNVESVKTVGAMRELMYSLIRIINTENKNDYFDFFKTVHALQMQAFSILEGLPKKETKNINVFEKDLTVNPVLAIFKDIFILSENFGFPNEQCERYFLEKFASKDFFHKYSKSKLNIRSYFTFYRYSQCPIYFDKICTQHPILLRLEELSREDPFFQEALKSYQWSYLRLIFLYILQARFYEHYLSIPTREVGDFIVLVELPPLPDLTPFQKVIMEICREDLYSNSLIKLVLEQFYCDKLVGFKSREDIEKDPKYNFSIDNEPIIRIKHALEGMGITFQREFTIMDKKVDFYLPEEKIILEFDGDMHINYQRMDVSIMTGFRNVLMLYSGYQMVIIDLFEFNQNRLDQQLQALIQAKLDLLRSRQAYLVQ